MNNTLLVFIVLTFCFTISFFIMLKKYNRLSKTSSKLFIDNVVMQEYIDLVKSKESLDVSDELVDKENFIKFLSDSRDWAFTYIEDAQEKISEFDKQIQEIAEWNRTYGSVVGDTPHSSKIEEINLAYDKIRSLLPENKTPNN